MPQTGDLSIFLNDESSSHTASSTLTSAQTPVSVLSTTSASVRQGQQHLDGSPTKNHTANGRVVSESGKLAKKPRSLKPKVLKSSAKEPPPLPKSPLATSVAASSRTPQGRPHESTKPRSSLAVHKTAAVASGHEKGKVGRARLQEGKENATPSPPLPVTVPTNKAHDILAEQVRRVFGKGSSGVFVSFCT